MTLCTIMHSYSVVTLCVAPEVLLLVAEYSCVCVWMCKAQKYTHS